MTVQQSIPASQIVNVTPNVLSAGGSALDLNGLYLTTSIRVPIGAVSSFPDAASVATFFGGSSVEARKAGVYFQGDDNSFLKPAALLFAQYPQVAVPAYLRGGNISAMTLAALQALNGTITATVDGFARTTGTVNLSAATSFSSAAGIIQTAFNSGLATLAGGSSSSISNNVFTAGGTITGTFATGQTLNGAGILAGTYITGQLSGTPGGAGTYSVTNSQTVGAENITATATPLAVTYDSVSGALVIASGVSGAISTITFAAGSIAAALLLQSAQGAVLSQGADATTPSAFMTSLTNVTQNWALFSTVFDPDGGSGNTQKVAFAKWNSQQNNRYCYVAWDTDASPTVSVPASASLGQIVEASQYSGVCVCYEPSDLDIEAFVMGTAASIDFTQTNGRTTFAFRRQAGLTPGVTSAAIAQNLIANDYNFYGSYATANANFVFFNPGAVSGPFAWMDSYVNEIWLNNNFQLALMNLLTSVGSIPYNSDGAALIEAGLADVINQGLDFGAFRTGVPLAAEQVAAVNAEAGSNIAPVLQTRGWYLQVKDAPPAVRQVRGSPPAIFFYVDGQSVQQISLTSVNVQ